jgi:hypothetical protein
MMANESEADMRVSIRKLAIVAVIAMTTYPAFAGGDDYDAMNDTEGKGPAYFGFVRDHRGAPVADAKVTLTPKAGEPVVLKSNVLGLYRSHISKDVRPDDVQLSCEKVGYRQASVLRRNAPGATDMNIETNCTLQRL